MHRTQAPTHVMKAARVDDSLEPANRGGRTRYAAGREFAFAGEADGDKNDLSAKIARERDAKKLSALMNQFIQLLTDEQDEIKAKINAELSKGAVGSM